MGTSEDREHQARMADYEKRLRGMNHQLNRAYADLEAEYKARKELTDRIERLDALRQEDFEVLGSLSNRVAELETWRVSLGEWLKKKEKTSGG